MVGDHNPVAGVVGDVFATAAVGVAVARERRRCRDSGDCADGRCEDLPHLVPPSCVDFTHESARVGPSLSEWGGGSGKPPAPPDGFPAPEVLAVEVVVSGHYNPAVPGARRVAAAALV